MTKRSRLSTMVLALVVCLPVPSYANHEQLNAVLWVQTSPEYEMCVTQTFRTARSLLERALAIPTWTAATEQVPGYEDHPPAIILDVDETVLDNSPYQADMVARNESFVSAAWDEWVAAARAPALPGARDFLRYAKLRGVKAFFVTNRSSQERAATLANLRGQFPDLAIADDQLLCSGERPEWTSDKTSRRSFIANELHHRILLLLGDDYGDFLALSKELSSEERRLEAGKFERFWGTRWLCLPNAMYGHWEKSLYGYERLPHEAQIRALKAKLRPWAR